MLHPSTTHLLAIIGLLGGAATVLRDPIPQPTLAVRLYRSGLDFFSSIGHKIVEREFPKADFPTLDIPINGGPGTGTVNVTNLYIPKFESPHFNFNLSPPSGIFFRSQGGAVKVTGNWLAVYDYVIKVDGSICFQPNSKSISFSGPPAVGSNWWPATSSPSSHSASTADIRSRRSGSSTAQRMWGRSRWRSEAA